MKGKLKMEIPAKEERRRPDSGDEPAINTIRVTQADQVGAGAKSRRKPESKKLSGISQLFYPKARQTC